MKKSMMNLISASIILGVIVLPQSNRARMLEMSLARSRSVESAYVVTNAVERFSQVNNGVYPPLVANFARFLPGRRPIENAITGVETEPVDGAASSPGAIGYSPISMMGMDVGFTITVFGQDATVGPNGNGTIFTISRQPMPETPE